MPSALSWDMGWHINLVSPRVGITSKSLTNFIQEQKKTETSEDLSPYPFS
jgi:hypothetical protein